MHHYISMSSNNVMSDDMIMKHAPAVFAEHPRGDVSDRYGFVPTIDVVNKLRLEGWYAVRAVQGRVHDQSNLSFAKHMLRFRKIDQEITVGDSIVELVLTNSHDRTSCYSIDLGLFRLVCSNGMVVSNGEFRGIKVRHGNRVAEQIIDASYEIIDDIPRINNQLERFETTILKESERKAFAESAMVVRYGETWKVDAPIKPDALLVPRRKEDIDHNLWSTLNVVQENLLRGGLPGVNRKNRRIRTRAIKSVREDLRLNKALWTLADRLTDLVA
jgi:hypothetical protein